MFARAIPRMEDSRAHTLTVLIGWMWLAIVMIDPLILICCDWLVNWLMKKIVGWCLWQHQPFSIASLKVFLAQFPSKSLPSVQLKWFGNPLHVQVDPNVPHLGCVLRGDQRKTRCAHSQITRTRTFGHVIIFPQTRQNSYQITPPFDAKIVVKTCAFYFRGWLRQKPEFDDGERNGRGSPWTILGNECRFNIDTTSE